jgi:hypothetical protein
MYRLYLTGTAECVEKYPLAFLRKEKRKEIHLLLRYYYSKISYVFIGGQKINMFTIKTKKTTNKKQ